MNENTNVILIVIVFALMTIGFYHLLIDMDHALKNHYSITVVQK